MKNVYKILILLLTLVLILTIHCINKSEVPNSSGLRALFFVPHYYGANYFLMRDAYEYMGWDVTHVSVSDTCQPCPAFAKVGDIPPIIPDKMVSQISNFNKYKVLSIVPSPGNFYKIQDPYQDIIGSKEALRFIDVAYENDLAVYAMCAGVKVLAAANIIQGKNIVGSSRFKQDYTEADAIYQGNDKNDNPPLIDGNIITGTRGQTYNYTNAETVTSVAEKTIKNKNKALDPDYIKAGEAKFSAKELQWSKTYGGSSADAGRAVCKTSDGGYLITGYTFGPDNIDTDILVIKTDSEGELIWKKVLGDAGMDFGNDCCPTRNGYLIVGYTTSAENGKRDIIIIKIDNYGNVKWEETFGGTENDVGVAVASTPEDHYYIGGLTFSSEKSEESILIVKITISGKELWSRIYGGKRMDRTQSISVSGDGGLIIGATSLSFGGRNSGFYILKINSSGDSIWAHNFNAPGKWGHGFDRCQDLSFASDEGYLLTGYSDCNDMMDAVVVKTDKQGRKEWIRTIGKNPFYDYGNSIIESSSGNYIIAGVTKTIPAENRLYDNDIFLTEMDKQGNVIQDIQIIGNENDWVADICSTDDGSLIIVGHTHSTENGSRDVCLLKINQ